MHPDTPPNAWPIVLALAAAVAAALLVLAEPMLQDLVPHRSWQRLRLDGLPMRAVPLLLLLAIFAAAATIWLARTAPSVEAAFIVAALAAAQLNGFRVGPLDAFDMVIFGFFAVWLALRALDPGYAVALPPVVLFGLGFLILQLGHLVQQSSPVAWATGLFGMGRAVLVALLDVNACREARLLALFQRAFVLVATLSALVAIALFLIGLLAGIHFTLIVPATEAFKPTPIGFVMRASGFCITAQHLSGFLAFATPFALWRLSETWRLRDALIVLVLWTGILFSWNFGGIFAAAAIGLAFPFLRWPQLAIHFALAGAAVGAALYFSGYLQLLWDLTFGDNGVMKGVDQRMTLFRLGLEQIDRNPWVGTGLQGFTNVHGKCWHRPAHNLFGQAASELGLAGARLVLAMLVTLATQATLLAAGPAGPERDLVRRIVLVLIGLAVLIQSEPMLDHANTWLMLGFAQASVSLTALRREPQPAR